MLLAKISSPRSLRPDMERWFLQDQTRISRFIACAMDHVLQYFNYTLAFDHDRLHRDIPAMSAKIAEAIQVPNRQIFKTWGDIDGTYRLCLRPTEK